MPRADADFIVWGDSHAMALAPAFGEAAQRSGRAGRLIASAGCAPLVGVSRADEPECLEFNRSALQAARAPGVRQVFLVSRWAIQAEGGRYGDEGGARVRLRTPAMDFGAHDNHQVFVQGLTATVDALRAAGKQVILVGSVPEASVSVPEALAKAKRLGRRTQVGPSLADYRARQGFVLRTVAALAAQKRLSVASPDATLCDFGRCRVELDGLSLYRDHDHLSAWGALS